MPNLKVIRQGITSLPLGPPLVVAIVAGTTGIGSYIARSLARAFAKHGSKLRVYIIGRNASNAESHMAYGRKTSPGSEWRFLAATDLTLLHNVDKICQQLIDQESASPFAGGPPRLDVLYMSQALSPMQASPETSEGLDSQLSLLYYSRLRFIQQLTPLLTANASNGTSRVISVFAGNMEDSIKPGAPLPIGAIEKDKYNITSVRLHTTFMKTFAFEHLAKQHAGQVSFTHIYPGLVDGPTFYSSANPLWFRIVWRIVKPLVSWYMTSAEDCGDIMVYLATKRYPAREEKVAGDADVAGGVAFSSLRERGGGAYALGMKADESKEVGWKKVRKSDTEERVWGNLMETFGRIEKMNEGK